MWICQTTYGIYESKQQCDTDSEQDLLTVRFFHYLTATSNYYVGRFKDFLCLRLNDSFGQYLFVRSGADNGTRRVTIYVYIGCANLVTALF